MPADREPVAQVDRARERIGIAPQRRQRLLEQRLDLRGEHPSLGEGIAGGKFLGRNTDFSQIGYEPETDRWSGNMSAEYKPFINRYYIRQLYRVSAGSGTFTRRTIMVVPSL